jgi:peptidoglycan/xylan/chitin deacetylase (PgdA/CDA1 family)
MFTNRSLPAVVATAIAGVALMSLNSVASARPAPILHVLAGAQCPKAAYGTNSYAPGYPRSKSVALTFDDGPGKSTARILEILRQFKVPATFFNIGENEAARPSLVKAEAKDGFVLGNHTWSHPDMAKLSARAQAAEMDRASDEQKSITGTVPCVFRPPGGDYNTTTLQLAQQRRLAVWLWSVDTEDWKARGSGSSYWVNRIIRLAEEEGGELHHPVVLMHNQPVGNPATVSALPTIIRYFRRHGYHFVGL